MRTTPRHVEERFYSALLRLAEDPLRPRPGLDVAGLAGPIGGYRLRIGAWRFFYQVDTARRIVLITAARPRPTAYR